MQRTNKFATLIKQNKIVVLVFLLYTTEVNNI